MFRECSPARRSRGLRPRPSGGTPLHEAVQNDKVAAIRCLVNECNANVEAVDKDGKTPLQWATKEETKQVLRELGAKI